MVERNSIYYKAAGNRLHYDRREKHRLSF